MVGFLARPDGSIGEAARWRATGGWLLAESQVGSTACDSTVFALLYDSSTSRIKKRRIEQVNGIQRGAYYS